MRILFGGLLIALMSANFVMRISTEWLFPQGSYDGWYGDSDATGNFKINYVQPEGPASVLQVNDEIIAINGVNAKEDRRILSFNRTVPPGTRYTMLVRRAGELREFRLQTVSFASYGPFRFNPIFLTILFFLSCGTVLLVLRPGEKQVWLLSVMLISLTGLMGGFSPSSILLRAIYIPAHVLGGLFFPAFVHFFLVFPERSPLLRSIPRFDRYLYYPYFILIIPTTVILVLGNDAEKLLSTSGLLLFRFIRNPISTVYVAGGLIAMILSYRAASPLVRRRLRVMIVGTGIGAFNLFLLLIGDLDRNDNFLQTVQTWIRLASVFTLPLIPISFVYAIARHKVLPISLIIRRSLRYLLVSRGSILLMIGIVSVIMFFVMDAFFYYLKPQSGRTVGVLSGIISIIVWQLSRAFYLRVVAPRIDKRFFRQSYDAQQIIGELGRSLRTAKELSQILESAAAKIQNALQTEKVMIYLRDRSSGAFINAHSLTRSPSDHQLEQRILEALRKHHADHRLFLDDLELGQLEQDGIVLLQPLASEKETYGLIALGPRLGDLPYSREDKQLLMNVAGPTVLAIENAYLVEKMIDEARRLQEVQAENELRAKELEEARQLQLSMLPKRAPQLPYLEIAAQMKTATDVGGDYYDFQVSETGVLTIAVGDATGHGLKAGTVVAATKSLFNYPASNLAITDKFHNWSRALKAMNLRSLYMAMTLIEVNGYSMTMSAAGMPPVLIYRAASQEIEEVSLRGVPLGSILSYQYRQCEVRLGPGDVVVLITDGLIERFNDQGEMFELERVKDALLESVHRPAQEIINHLMAKGDQWAAGRAQDDDSTFLVIKIK